MLKSLKSALSQRSISEIKMQTGETLVGFLTRVDEESFDIVIFEPILPEPTEENMVEDEMGNQFLAVDPKELDYAPAKYTFITAAIYSICADVSHKLSASFLKTAVFIRDNNVFAPKVAPKIKKPARNVTKDKLSQDTIDKG